MKNKVAITPELLQAVKTALLARAYTETIRPTVVEIQKAVLAKYQYRYEPKYIDRRENLPEFITDPKHYWMMNDKDAGHYYTELNIAYRRAGFDVELNYCPLLIAESTERDALRAMVDASIYIAVSQGLNESDFERLYYKLDWIKTYQEAIIGLVVTQNPKEAFNTPVALAS